MKLSKGCPHCGKPAYPIMDEAGNILWRNLFRVDFVMLGIVVGIVLLLLGFKQINEQCYEILENPCAGYQKYCGNLTYGTLDWEAVSLAVEPVVSGSGP